MGQYGSKPSKPRLRSLHRLARDTLNLFLETYPILTNLPNNPDTSQPPPTIEIFGSVSSSESAEPDLLVESSPVDDMLSSEIAAIEFFPKAQDPCGQRPSSPLSNSSGAAFFNPAPSVRETVSSELPLSSVRVVACVSKTDSVVDESSMKSKYFSHWPASLLEGPFGPHKIVIPKFWTYDSDEDT